MRYTDLMLDALRRQGDPQADRVVAELAARGELARVRRLLETLLHSDQAVPEELPEAAVRWLEQTGDLPSWVNRRRLERGAAFFAEHGVLVSLILATDSLVECYAARKGVKVLTATYRMAQNPYRRIAETAQWVLLVMAPGGLGPEGQGIRATQKVRLMHAAIRHLILAAGGWDLPGWGVPINQEDLAGTLMAFSYIVLRDLRKLGVTVSDGEAEDFLYIWRAVGEMIGVRPSVIPTGMAEAQALTEAIFRRHHGPSPDGVLMTRALLEMHASMVPGELFDGIIPALLRHLAGDQVADWMEVPRTPWEAVAARVATAVGRAENQTGLLRKAARRLGIAFLQVTAIAMTDYRRASFSIPEELRRRWKL
ncbi:MAG TPA: oxygenase MpaB family protein [Symbiobacteriaceae bacterium]|nr:oxygenase MpaB family protein [Symbiobacteriaceae bacterium]